VTTDTAHFSTLKRIGYYLAEKVKFYTGIGSDIWVVSGGTSLELQSD